MSLWKDTDDDSPAPPFCVDVSDTSIHPTAYDGNPMCTPKSGEWDVSWQTLLKPFCDSWFHSSVDTTRWMRFTPLWWNKTCNCSASQLDTYNARKKGCSDPFTFQSTKYLFFTHYLQTTHNNQKDPSQTTQPFKTLQYYKAWSLQTNMLMRDNSTKPVTVIHVCSDESKDITYAILGKISDGFVHLVPDNWVLSGYDGDVYLLIMGNQQPLDLLVHGDTTTPETMKRRVARMDYVDKSVSAVDPPLHKAISKSLYIKIGVAMGILLLAIAAYKMYGGDKKKKPTPSIMKIN